MQTLDQLSLNRSAEIKNVAPNPFRTKLFDMGLYPGQIIKVTNKAPFGDPLAVKLDNGMLMLRVTEAASIEVEEIE